jgi:hypothetical protein
MHTDDRPCKRQPVAGPNHWQPRRKGWDRQPSFERAARPARSDPTVLNPFAQLSVRCVPTAAPMTSAPYRSCCAAGRQHACRPASVRRTRRDGRRRQPGPIRDPTVGGPREKRDRPPRAQQTVTTRRRAAGQVDLAPGPSHAACTRRRRGHAAGRRSPGPARCRARRRPWDARTREHAFGIDHRCCGPGRVFVGYANVGAAHDSEYVDNGAAGDNRFAAWCWGLVDGDDRSGECGTDGLGDLRRRRVSRWSRNGWSRVAACRSPVVGVVDAGW